MGVVTGQRGFYEPLVEELLMVNHETDHMARCSIVHARVDRLYYDVTHWPLKRIKRYVTTSAPQHATWLQFIVGRASASRTRARAAASLGLRVRMT